ncbi:MAG TPA: RuBisCO large subunit C-terminal-like domain-containing protein [bacterium]|nr:RuBisCO large subunit C-terminal-like domain-containing protein [bacterium]
MIKGIERFNEPSLIDHISGMRFSVIYQISGTESEALETAEKICIEQTVEFPEDLIPKGAIRDHIFGRIENFQIHKNGSYTAEISYAIEICGNELTQFITVLFGNISLMKGIRILKITGHNYLRNISKGPRFGIEGLRKLTGVHDRALLCGAIKPMGLGPSTLAEMAADFTLGGIDLIKDDHGLADQPFCRFKERVKAVSNAVNEINSKTGSKTLYAPSISSSASEVIDRAHFAKEAGAGALLIAPFVTGIDFARMISEDESIALPVIAHPALSGSFVNSDENGISHYALFGQLMRMSGCDASVFPSYGGRFSFSKDECSSIQKGCGDPFAGYSSIFPAPGGGMTLERIPELKEFYGNNAMFLIGGGMFRNGGNITENVKRFKEAYKKNREL